MKDNLGIYPTNATPEYRAKVRIAVSDMYSKRQSSINRLEEDWNSKSAEYLKYIKAEFPEFKLEMIRIQMKIVGTIASYMLPNYNDWTKKYREEGKIYLNPRYDASAEDLFEVLVVALTHFYEFDSAELQNNDLTLWNQKQDRAAEIVHKYLPHHRTFNEILDTQTVGQCALETTEYLEELGLSVPKYIDEHIEEAISGKEAELLEVLKTSEGKVVEFDQIYDIVWPDKCAEDYSLYAINKLAQRLRETLKENGINTELIHTQRGLGYYLFD